MEKYPYINCLEPQRVKNRYTKELILVPCGKCEACINHKGLMLTQKCQLEAKSHKYVYFVTLTYSNEFVPTAKITKYYGKAVLVSDDGEILSEAEYDKEFINLLYSKCNHSNKINILQKRDLQLFIKRLRKRIKNEKIRYFACGEYGPVHFRPHYHILLFFDQQQTSESIEQNISEAWRYGRIDVSLSKGDCSAYTAKYVNSRNNLPEILRNSEVGPFSVHSQHLGEEILRRSQEEIEKLTPIEFINFGLNINGKFKNVTMWSSLASWYWPKCRGFNSLSDVECLPLYQLNRTVAQWCRLSRPSEQAKYILDDLYQSASCPFGDYYTYLPECVKLIVDICNINVYNIPAQYEKVYSQVYTLLRTSSHFLNNISKDGRDLHHIKRIKHFYSEIAKAKLYEQLTLQQEFALEFETTQEEDFYAFYPDKFAFSNIKEQPIYKAYYTQQKKISRDSIKHKKLNDLNQMFNK